MVAGIIAFIWINIEKDLKNENRSIDKVLEWWMIIIYSLMDLVLLCNFSKLQSWFWHTVENLENKDKKMKELKLLSILPGRKQ